MKYFSPKIIVITLAALLVLGGSSYYAYTSHENSQKTSQKSSATAEDRPVGDTNYDKPTDAQQNPATDQTPTQPQTPQQAQGAPIPVVISYAGGSPLQVRVVMSEILSSGTCTLSLQKGGTTVTTQTADVFPTASSTTCKGFTVDTSSLAKGNYTVTITVESGNRTGSASSNIAI